MRGDLRGDSRGVNTARASAHDNRFASEFEAAKGFGWTVGENHFDWGLLKVNRDAEVGRLEAIYRRNLNNAGVVIHQGHARMIDQSTVAIDNATTLQGKTILIATGAQAVNDLSDQGYELCIDSNAFFEMERQPRRVLVHGAGYIALELAPVFRHLGSEVQVVYQGEKLLRGFDDELRTHLESELRLTRLKLMPDTGISQIRKDSDSLRVELSNGDASEVDCVLKAIGRKPNTDGLGLETIGISWTAKAQSRSTPTHKP